MTSLRLHWISFITLTSLAAGCYGATPPRPLPIPLPEPTPGATITVTTEEETSLEEVPKKLVTCPQGHVEGSPECVITRYTELEPVTTTTTTARYGDTDLTGAQFVAMTDPEREAKLERFDRAAGVCRRARIPRVVGMGLAIGGLVALGVGAGAKSTAVTVAGEISIAGGVGSFALGYFALGGRQCNVARRLWEELEVSGQVGTTFYGPDLAVEMKRLADEFNAGAEAAASR